MVRVIADPRCMDTPTASIRTLPARRTLPALFVATALVMFALAFAPTSASAALPRHAVAIDSVEAAEVRMINSFRRARGLRPLRIDGTLTRTAGWHAINLGTNRIFSHTDSLGRNPFQRLRAFGYPSRDTWRGENLAAGNAAAAPTYRQWLNSPPHRANWENRRYTSIGIARVRVAGSPYGYYWVTTFGSRWTRPAA